MAFSQSLGEQQFGPLDKPKFVIKRKIAGPVVKNLPSNAGDAGSISGRGTKIPRAAGQLSPCATTTELTRPGACAPQLERSPRTAAKDPACLNEDLACQQLSPMQPKINKINKSLEKGEREK